MANARSAWGIDIGNRALKAVRVTRTGAGVRIDDYDVIEHEQILSNAGDNRDSLIQASLATFVQRHNFKGSVASVGVSGQASFARFTKLPPVERKQIPNIVRFEAIQQIPFPLEDVEWSYQLFETPDSPDVEVGIFAMRKELVAHHLQFFTQVDLNVQNVQMNPLAVYNAMQYDGRLTEPTMILVMGAETTDVIIGDDHSVWHRSIGLGGNTFTDALVKAFKLDFRKAEDLKRTAGTSKYTRQIFQAMRPVFGDLVSEIQRTLGFFASGHRETRIKRIIALGGTFRLPNLVRYLQQNLQLDVVRVDSFRAGAPADPKQAAGFTENLLSLASAYGLALQGLDEGKIQSSLLPATIRRERMWREKTKWFAAAAALMVAGTGIAYGSIYLAKASGESDPARREANDQLLAQANRLSADWSQVQTAGAADRDTIKNLFKLTDYRLLWANLINDIGTAIPQPQPEVAQGLREWDAEKVKSVPRVQRKIITLTNMHSRYVPDVSKMTSDPDFRKYANAGASIPGAGSEPFGGSMGGPMGPMGPMGPGGPMGPSGPMGPTGPTAGTGATSATPARGFLITMTIRTPYGAAHDLVQNGLLKNLMSIRYPDDPNKRYMVTRADVVSVTKLASNQQALKEIQDTHDILRGKLAPSTGNQSMPGLGTGYGGPYGGDYGGMATPSPYGNQPSAYTPPPPGDYGRTGPGTAIYPGMPGGTAAAEAPKFPDPLTEEDVSNDWEFVILFAVAVEPPAAMLAAPGSPGATGVAGETPVGVTPAN